MKTVEAVEATGSMSCSYYQPEMMLKVQKHCIDLSVRALGLFYNPLKLYPWPVCWNCNTYNLFSNMFGLIQSKIAKHSWCWYVNMLCSMIVKNLNFVILYSPCCFSLIWLFFFFASAEQKNKIIWINVSVVFFHIEVSVAQNFQEHKGSVKLISATWLLYSFETTQSFCMMNRWNIKPKSLIELKTNHFKSNQNTHVHQL